MWYWPIILLLALARSLCIPAFFQSCYHCSLTKPILLRQIYVIRVKQKRKLFFFHSIVFRFFSSLCRFHANTLPKKKWFGVLYDNHVQYSKKSQPKSIWLKLNCHNWLTSPKDPCDKRDAAQCDEFDGIFFGVQKQWETVPIRAAKRMSDEHSVGFFDSISIENERIFTIFVYHYFYHGLTF